jgi:hypothetical protein
MTRKKKKKKNGKKNGKTKNKNKVQPDEKMIIRTAKPFGDRGAYVYVPPSWLGREVEIRLYHQEQQEHY